MGGAGRGRGDRPRARLAVRLYTARWVLPVTAPPVRDGAVAVDPAGRIAYVGPAAGAPPGGAHPLGAAVLLPGLVAHAPPGPPPPAAFLARGATTLAIPVADEGELAALLASGVRAVAYRMVAGPLPADREPALVALRAAVARTHTAIADAGATARVHPGVAAAPAYAAHEDLLIDACAWAVGERLPLAVTAGASPAEVDYLREATGLHADALRTAGVEVVRRAYSTVHLLAELGVAAVARPLLVGGTEFDESDVALAAYYGCPVAYMPLGIAPAPLHALLDAGVPVALAASDPLATAARLARTPSEALDLVTLGAARALGLDADVGSLEVGKSADLCAFPLDTAACRAADADGPAAALCAHSPRAPTLTLVQGRART